MMNGVYVAVFRSTRALPQKAAHNMDLQTCLVILLGEQRQLLELEREQTCPKSRLLWIPHVC